MSSVKLIVGLCNPGTQYQDTRHNAGAWFVERIAEGAGVSLAAQSKFFGLVGQAIIQGRGVRLLVPTTFMNRSGQAIAAVANFYRIEPEEILVAHDELDLPCGVARLKQGGGHGGHNGLRDTITALGNNKSFGRLRVGIGHPGHKSKVTGYVLSKPSSDDRIIIDRSIDDAIKVLPDVLAGQWQAAQHSLHSQDLTS